MRTRQVYLFTYNKVFSCISLCRTWISITIMKDPISGLEADLGPWQRLFKTSSVLLECSEHVPVPSAAAALWQMSRSLMTGLWSGLSRSVLVCWTLISGVRVCWFVDTHPLNCLLETDTGCENLTSSDSMISLMSPLGTVLFQKHVAAFLSEFDRNQKQSTSLTH